MASDVPEPARVVVVNFDMSFGRLVVFMVKVGLAAIPAMLILAAIGFFTVAFLSGVFNGYARRASVDPPAHRAAIVSAADPSMSDSTGPSAGEIRQRALRNGVQAERTLALNRCAALAQDEAAACAKRVGDCIRAHDEALLTSTGAKELTDCMKRAAAGTQSNE